MASVPVTEAQAREAASQFLEVPPPRLLVSRGGGGWMFVVEGEGRLLGGSRVYVDSEGRGYDVPSFVPAVARLELLLAADADFARRAQRFNVTQG